MPPGSVIHRSISDDGVIEVVQEHSNRSLYFGSAAKQSEMNMSQPEKLVLSYTQAMMASLLFCQNPSRALIIGLGGGSLVRFLLHHFPSCLVDVVEFREDVVKLAHDYFHLPNDSRLKITIDDGYDFLSPNNQQEKEYDLLLIDAFDHDGVASSIRSINFFNRCYAAMSDTGIAAINLWNSKLDQFSETMANMESGFQGNVLDMPVKDKGNIIAFAARSKERFPPFRTLKPIAEELEYRLELPIGTYLHDLRRHNRWRALARFF